jgi:hypothetical protein
VAASLMAINFLQGQHLRTQFGERRDHSIRVDLSVDQRSAVKQVAGHQPKTFHK